MKRSRVPLELNGYGSQAYRWDPRQSHLKLRGLVFGFGWHGQGAQVKLRAKRRLQKKQPVR